jgi:CRP-like cAMP-binding protein
MIHEKINSVIRSVVDCSDYDLLFLNSLLKEYRFKKNTILIEAGEVANMLFFINKGCARAYFYFEDKEFTTILRSENEFITAFTSFSSRKISNIEVQCLTDCDLLGISWENAKLLINKCNIWYEFDRRMKNDAIIKLEQRLREQVILTAKQRYEKFVNQNPFLAQNCPVKHLASYLGIHPESLSRIRKEAFSNKC